MQNNITIAHTGIQSQDIIRGITSSINELKLEIIEWNSNLSYISKQKCMKHLSFYPKISTKILPLISVQELWNARHTDQKGTKFSWRSDDLAVQKALHLSFKEINQLEQETKIDITQFCLISLENYAPIKLNKEFKIWFNKLPEASKPDYIKHKYPHYYEWFGQFTQENPILELRHIRFKICEYGTGTFAMELQEFWEQLSEKERTKGQTLEEIEQFIGKDLQFYYQSFEKIETNIIQKNKKNDKIEENKNVDGNIEVSAVEFIEWLDKVKEVEGFYSCNWDSNTKKWTTSLLLAGATVPYNPTLLPHLKPFGYIPTKDDLLDRDYFLNIRWGYICRLWGNRPILLVTDHCTIKSWTSPMEEKYATKASGILLNQLLKQHILENKPKKAVKVAHALMIALPIKSKTKSNIGMRRGVAPFNPSAGTSSLATLVCDAITNYL